jgi:hypothetical protein
VAKQWSELTREEKREERFRRWLAPADVKFNGPEAGGKYRAGATRLLKAIKIEIPDRVPVLIPSGFYIAYYAGITLRTVMYHPDKLKSAWLKFLRDFDQDAAGRPRRPVSPPGAGHRPGVLRYSGRHTTLPRPSRNIAAGSSRSAERTAATFSPSAPASTGATRPACRP